MIRQVLKPLGGVALLAGLLLGPAGAGAQDARWLKDIPGFGSPVRQFPRVVSGEDPRGRKPEPPNDLRPNSVPLRSQLMIEALEGAIQRYQDIVNAGGWPLIPGDRMIRPEDDDERLPVLRRRLIMGGELRAKAPDLFGFHDDIDPAVRRFQESHGLRVTGRVDRSTLQALNVPAQARLNQLRLNLHRLRELTQKVEDRYILVNVPAFQLEAVDHGEVQQRHRVIDGKPERQTPTVRATIRALNFFPYWRVPDSVASLDLIPRLVKEPDYLQKEQIRVLTGSFNGPEIDPSNIDWRQADATRIKFRQDPGPQNALGLVRIDMPNEHGVYMHDTPMKPLFNQRTRAFSAGCVRVQDVFDLVEWIARYEPGWEQPGRARDIIAGGQPVDVTLSRPIPVYFTYITAWAEPDGRVNFRPDIYSRDGSRELVAQHDRDPADGPPPPWTLTP
ncbi:MAG TPA: L,D-transpeptidase family protein [Hyphomicrobiaceae bacterium]|jgi:murein L,D-transpeptidase YcbB/YkuD|nr:L,D-transpeptidase family protein [Hyphomicrobiaceae bacterium]